MDLNYLVWGQRQWLARLFAYNMLLRTSGVVAGNFQGVGTSVKFGAPKSHLDVLSPLPAKKLGLLSSSKDVNLLRTSMHSGKMYIRHLFHYGQFRFITYKIITNVVEFLHIHGLS